MLLEVPDHLATKPILMQTALHLLPPWQPPPLSVLIQVMIALAHPNLAQARDLLPYRGMDITLPTQSGALRGKQNFRPSKPEQKTQMLAVWLQCPRKFYRYSK